MLLLGKIDEPKAVEQRELRMPQAAGGNVEAVVSDVVGAQLAVAPMIEAAQRMGQVDEAGFRIGESR